MGYEDGIFKKSTQLSSNQYMHPSVFQNMPSSTQQEHVCTPATNSNDEQSLVGGARGAFNDVIIPRLKEVTD